MGDNYPNIFDYATKEFTLDAIVMWFLKCFEQGKKNEDEEVYSIGKKFLQDVILKDTGIEVTEDYKVECLKKQCCRIDVYMCLEHKENESYIPIIIENKVNTTLHNDQLSRYCKMVEEWFENYDKELVYVYFKIGYMPEFEKKWVEEQFQEFKKREYKLRFVTLDDLLIFLKTNQMGYQQNEIYRNYLKFCEDLQNKQTELKAWDKNTSLCEDIGQFRFFEAAFDDVNHDNCFKVNSGGMSNCCYCFYGFKDGSALSFRFEPRWKKTKGEEYRAEPYLQLQYYRHNSNSDERFEKIHKITQNFKMNDIIIFELAQFPKSSCKGCEVGRFTFNQNNKNIPSDVADCLKEFRDYLKEELSEIE